MILIFRLLLFSVIVLVVSCKGPQRLYQENLILIDSAGVVQRNNIQFEEPRIQVNDLLSIQVQTADIRTNALFNNTQQLINQPGTTALLQGYQVGIDSTLNFPLLGKIKVVDLTRNEVENIVTERVGAYIKEKPSVQVRYLNFKITVMGEVTRPGTFSFPTDRVTLFEALGTAGDLTIFARRNKVWLIREINQKREFQFINLQEATTFNASNYFLKQNDVIYVEPGPKKFIQSDPVYNRSLQNISVGLSSLGFIIAMISLFR